MLCGIGFSVCEMTPSNPLVLIDVEECVRVRDKLHNSVRFVENAQLLGDRSTTENRPLLQTITICRSR